MYIHKNRTPLYECMYIQLQILWLWYCQVQSGIDSHMGLCLQGFSIVQ